MIEAAEKGPQMTREAALELVQGLVSDSQLFREQLDFHDGTLTDSAAEQYLGLVALLLEAFYEFAGRGMSIFVEQPQFRIPGLNVEDHGSILSTLKKLKAAQQALRPKQG